MKNTGAIAAANVVLNDILPGTLTFVSCNTSQGTCGAVLNNVTANLGTINPGQTATVSIVATVGAAVPNATQIFNTATATTTTPESDTTNNSSTTFITVSNVCPLGMKIATTLVSGNPIPPPGSTQTYVYKVILTACNAVYGITAVGNAPGLTVNPVPSVGTFTITGPVSNPQINWRVVNLLAGQTATLLVTVKRTIPANTPNGTLLQITGPWSATYFFAASLRTAGPTPSINAIVTTP